MKVEEWEMEKTVDTILSINFTLEDLHLNEERPTREPNEQRDTSLAHIHHIDVTRENNALDNLILYCVACHMKVHHSSQYPQLKPEYIRSKKKSQTEKEPEPIIPIEIPETILVDTISLTLSELGGSVGILLLSQKTKIEVNKLIPLIRKHSSTFHLELASALAIV